jgi:hypothetical protein
MEKLNSALRQDIVKLRGTVKSLDIEKDNLQQQVDEKTERVMALDARRVKQVLAYVFVFLHNIFSKLMWSKVDRL